MTLEEDPAGTGLIAGYADLNLREYISTVATPGGFTSNLYICSFWCDGNYGESAKPISNLTNNFSANNMMSNFY